MVTNEIESHIQKRFEIRECLGKGGYGIVWKAINKKDRTVVALKKCFDAFRNSTDAQRTFREIMYLHLLSTNYQHNNIIQLKHIIRATNESDIYLTFEYMQTDLNTVIRSEVLLDIHIRFITWQLIRAVKFLHSAGLIHRDIKPSNILMNANCHIKLCDFGLCRSILDEGEGEKGDEIKLNERKNPLEELSEEQQQQIDNHKKKENNSNHNDKESIQIDSVVTDYIATRWYRAPEILFGSVYYKKSVDIWAIGAVLGEMILSRPIFPGSSTLHQLELITRLIGLPNREEIIELKSPYIHAMLAALPPLFYSEGSNSSDKWKNKFPTASNDALKMIKKCLKMSPSERGTANDLLKFSYIKDFTESGVELSEDKKESSRDNINEDDSEYDENNENNEDKIKNIIHYNKFHDDSNQKDPDIAPSLLTISVSDWKRLSPNEYKRIIFEKIGINKKKEVLNK